MCSTLLSSTRFYVSQIPLVKDLPGVGSNLQDHITAGANNVALNGESEKLWLNLGQMMSPSATWEYIFSKSGILIFCFNFIKQN